MPKKKQHQFNIDSDNMEQEKPSRSQKKRDSTSLQVLGEQLISFPLKIIDKIEISPDLKEALHLLSRINDHEGRRRQKQYIGKLMRYEDVQALQKTLEKYAAKSTQENANFHRIEKLRSSLLNANAQELNVLLDAFPDKNPDKKSALQTLVENAKQEVEKQSLSTSNIPPTAQRILFRALRDLLE